MANVVLFAISVQSFTSEPAGVSLSMILLAM